ncbi:MAG: hypothetical protein H6719_33300 [Sandaracinaceae bacterium]|nr:hypothetical protein [Sandaracinaceae bacterium]
MRLERLGAWLALTLAACGGTSHTPRFPLQDVVWTDHDTRAFEGPPEGFYSSYTWDGADNAVFRPLAEFWTFQTDREALNVNALDEVPSSSWYVNRLSRQLMTPEEVARGACADLDDDLPGPWRIVGGKPDGANPGFQIVDATGTRYLMKTDGHLQEERPGAADVIGALIWHAAGFNVPCNRVVIFDRSILELDPEATIERTDGSEEALTDAHVEAVLEKATRLPDGRYRASVSQFIDGRPISPWRYHSTRDGDPNDAIPHEHRRDLRAQYVLSAWTDHIDARQENTMAAWVATDDDHGFVRHYLIDFGDCFGILHGWDSLVRRFGHSGYLDVQHILTDFVTLGMVDRPWYHAAYGPAGITLGYYDSRRFVPDEWRPGYANNAYDQITEADAAWATRIISRFGDEHIRAMVARGRFSDPIVASELARILIGRRDRILERWLTRLSPLSWPTIRASEDGPALCMQDLAVWSGIREEDGRRYHADAWAGDPFAPVEGWSGRVGRADDGYACVPLPRLEGATEEQPAYLVVDVTAQSASHETAFPARVHLYQLGESYRIVGLERPANREPPR